MATGKKTSPKRKVGKIPRPKKKKSALRKITKWHLLLTIAALSLYLGLGFWLGPGALKQDIEGKVAGVSSTVLSLHIAGPPAKPVVTATPGCDSSSPYIQLSWDATNDTDDYDIDRDSAPLITGITTPSYKDTNVSANTTYAYEVTANGPLGNTASDTVSATTGDCYVPLPDPTNEIITIENINLTTYNKIPKIKKRTPTFTGTTNIAHALIQAELYTGPLIISSTTANGNGYWSWKVPQKLDYGSHTLYVTATDPSDSSRYKTDQVAFKVIREDEEEEDEDEEEETAAPALVSPVSPGPAAPGAAPSEKNAPFNLKLEIENKDKVVYVGSDLATKLSVIKLRDFGEGNDLVKYKIIDSRGNTVLDSEETFRLKEGEIYRKSIRLPVYLRAGRYTVRAETEKEGFLISAEDSFEAAEKPILNLGGGVIITYPQLVSTVGYIFIFLLLLLVLFLLLTAREYWLTKQARFFVDEEELSRDGYIS